MKMGPSIPTTELVLIPRPRTTVGYSSEAMSGSTTKDEEIPIFPTQYRTNVTLVSGKQTIKQNNQHSTVQSTKKLIVT